ncbi:MAG: adenosylmethionine--8-amino-7-oxononanoate transaminase [Rhodospirillaceae bacterium]|jgi:adenosylmethionine---8-amino-7-oxononanoate aminotransferase|nr:adenosylmethionine--8-amino-7-oxononanoate transaminase [Rhodospirillaceae bacterium]MBT5659058.1 adenosylmethionine--8-amino-7-oxononanoate transaminase [Rhodospirillaceae bacterium]MBT5752534.1 adenosylmethionine--8-amino-7-oxononanoate transaminase [Rhodospirillaceae bacterium]
MADKKDISALDKAHVWHPFTQMRDASPPIEIVSGRGAELFGADGKTYIDLVSSWWVTIHGHAHPVIAKAIAAQAEKLEQVIFADFTHAPAARLAARLADLLPGDLSKVFYSDNGSTSVEVAMKIAWQYWRNMGNSGRKRFLSFSGGYHGDTLGAMSLGASTGFYAPFEDQLLDVEFLPYPDTWIGDNESAEKEAVSLAALDACLDRHGDELAAVIIEPLIQGAGGMRMCRPEFLAALCHRLREAGVLLIFDEVMTGFGRTGEMFACEKADVVPDIICLAKGLTGGFLPLAATVCSEDIFEAFYGDDFSRAFAHGHSFTANPLGCAAAHASLDLFTQENTLVNIEMIESAHRRGLAELSDIAGVERARLMGSVAAFDIGRRGEGYGAEIGATLKQAFIERGYLIRPLGNVVYLMPPYCITKAALEESYDAIAGVLATIVI